MMAPEQQFAAVKDMRSNALDMLAIYHSHPATPARPSAEDIRLALTPNVVYLILSLQGNNGPGVKGFEIEDGDVTEVAVRITEDQR
jgi:proteasome lid subunit RPN8/RPN11